MEGTIREKIDSLGWMLDPTTTNLFKYQGITLELFNDLDRDIGQAGQRIRNLEKRIKQLESERKPEAEQPIN